jgi:hypothetical protein
LLWFTTMMAFDYGLREARLGSPLYTEECERSGSRLRRGVDSAAAGTSPVELEVFVDGAMERIMLTN